MNFLTPDDFKIVLNGQLFKILVQDNTQIDVAVNAAIAEVRAKLSGRFDMDTVFAASGQDRNPLILMWTVYIATQIAVDLISAQNVPKWIDKNYNTAITRLTEIQNNKDNPGLPLLPGERPTGTFRFGGQQKVTKRI